jgi:hypothetical protein
VRLGFASSAITQAVLDTARIDQLLVAIEVNEWALCASLAERAARCNSFVQALVADTLETAMKA